MFELSVLCNFAPNVLWISFTNSFIVSYIKLQFRPPKTGKKSALLHLWLEEQPVLSGWEETESGEWCVYVPEAAYTEAWRGEWLALAEELGLRWKEEREEERNWNAVWERSYEPVEVGDFCRIRASFHEPSAPGSFRYELEITPRMAFGTGHHATTHLMLQELQKGDWAGKAVLDYGCGTAVLGILAARLGAARIDALDIDPLAVENARENCQTNQTPQVRVHQGSLSELPAGQYDCILANINRNILIDNMRRMHERLLPAGKLYLSGFLASEIPLLVQSAQPWGLRLLQECRREDWACLVLGK